MFFIGKFGIYHIWYKVMNKIVMTIPNKDLLKIFFLLFSLLDIVITLSLSRYSARRV